MLLRTFYSIIGLINRPEIDTKQVLALLALAKKAKCIDMGVYSSIMDHYLARDGTQAATKIYDYLKDEPFLSPRSYNTLIKTLCNGGQVDKALESFQHMVDSGVQPNRETFTLLLFHTKKRTELCMKLFGEMEKYGIRPTTKMYNIAILSCRWSNSAVQALQLRDQMVEKGIPMDMGTYSALMSTLLSVGRLNEGLALFEELKQHAKPTPMAYTRLFLEGKNNLARVEELLKDMENAGIQPTIEIYNISLACYGKHFDMTGMKGLFARMLASGVKPCILFYRCVVPALLQQTFTVIIISTKDLRHICDKLV